MRSAHSHIGMGGITALIATLGAGAATITPLSQDRGVGSFVIVPPCPPATLSDNDEATTFDPYDASVIAQRTCDFGHGLASADQQSSIHAARMLAIGSAHSEAAAAPTTVIHAIPNSSFMVQFQTQVPTRAILLGTLSASGALPVVASSARVGLNITGGANLHSQIVNPLAGGAMNTQNVHVEIMLPAGSYDLRASAAPVIDSTVPPIGEGDASFDVQALIQRAGDANVDGDVNILDLLATIAAWGACPAQGGPCLADMDGNSVVNISDLLNVISHWGR